MFYLPEDELGPLSEEEAGEQSERKLRSSCAGLRPARRWRAGSCSAASASTSSRLCRDPGLGASVASDSSAAGTRSLGMSSYFCGAQSQKVSAADGSNVATYDCKSS